MKTISKFRILADLDLLIICSFVILLGLAFVLGTGTLIIKKSDDYIRQQIVLLTKDGNNCTGFRVSASSGRVYTLTAGHCRPLLRQDNTVTSVDEDGTTSTLTFVAESKSTDLMLLTASKYSQLNLAEKVRSHEQVKTLTRGLGFPTHRTNGEFLSIKHIESPMFPINNETDFLTCMSQSKYKIGSIMMFLPVCLLSIDVMVSTAPVHPGSSGGPMLNMDGDIVGVVVLSQGDLSGSIDLKDVRNFLGGF